jgi:hypothetical protein
MPEQSPDDLLAEVRTWKHNRAVYPGWLIAPDDVGGRLWRHTEGLDPALPSGPPRRWVWPSNSTSWPN